MQVCINSTRGSSSVAAKAAAAELVLACNSIISGLDGLFSQHGTHPVFAAASQFRPSFESKARFATVTVVTPPYFSCAHFFGVLLNFQPMAVCDECFLPQALLVSCCDQVTFSHCWM
mmetsp:Transcript_20337/g.39047  ORF Transcript_20337/g.39047 Transcript_20337/m.39047 type:complete len:117 (-) Transcript_20337:174-524(-)